MGIKVPAGSIGATYENVKENHKSWLEEVEEKREKLRLLL